MNNLAVEKVMSFCNIHNYILQSPSSGYRNKSFPIILKDGTYLNLIFYKREKDIVRKIKNANAVSEFLCSQGFPTRQSFKINGKSIIELKTSKFTQYACLYNYLEGSTIPWEAYTAKHIKLLGGMMGKMHGKLENCKCASLPKAVEDSEVLLAEMKEYFDIESVIEAMRKKLNLSLNFNFDEFEEKVLERLSLENLQPLHLDFVRGNILFKTEKVNSLNNIQISGILDFEKVAFGPRVLDIARTLAFLIIDCKYKEEAKIRKYFLYNGYQKRGENKLPDLIFLEDLLNFYWLHDFYKLLLYNPYEFLESNEHYIRTKNVLLERNILQNKNGE